MEAKRQFHILNEEGTILFTYPFESHAKIALDLLQYLKPEVHWVLESRDLIDENKNHEIYSNDQGGKLFERVDPEDGQIVTTLLFPFKPKPEHLVELKKLGKWKYNKFRKTWITKALNTDYISRIAHLKRFLDKVCLGDTFTMTDWLMIVKKHPTNDL